jgi:hypothetical protein
VEFKETNPDGTPKNVPNNFMRSKYNNTKNNSRKIVDLSNIHRLEKPIRTMEHFYKDQSSSIGNMGLFKGSDLTGMDTEIMTMIQNLRKKSQLKQTFDEFSRGLDNEAEERRTVLDNDLWKVSHLNRKNVNKETLAMQGSPRETLRVGTEPGDWVGGNLSQSGGIQPMYLTHGNMVTRKPHGRLDPHKSITEMTFINPHYGDGNRFLISTENTYRNTVNSDTVRRNEMSRNHTLPSSGIVAYRMPQTRLSQNLNKKE